MVHVAVYKYDFEKINILEYAFGEGGGGNRKAYAVYAFINVDNCERPLSARTIGCRDNVVWDEEQQKLAEEKVASNSKTLVPEDMQGMSFIIF